MKKLLFVLLTLVFVGTFTLGAAMAFSTEDLAKASTLEEILKRGELRVGMEAGYQPFETQDEKGNIVGFDVDMAYEMEKPFLVTAERRKSRSSTRHGKESSRP